MKQRLYMAAVNQRYGHNVFLPYAAGLMWGYARQFSEIAEAYELCGMLYLKEPIEKALTRLDRPDVLALSSYIWNHEWNKALARAVKQRWPSCVTLVGGVQVPDESPAALQECEAFDFAIYGEGEGAFADFLRTRRDVYPYCSSVLWQPRVGSLIWRDPFSGIHLNPRHTETMIESIPSPYLDGLFDDIAQQPDLSFQALQETNRGCPYACSFCAWGAASLSKLRQFSEGRILDEYEWMAKHKIEFLYNCDANYGILKRDIDLTEALVAVRRKTGYPQKFRAAFAKNSNDVVFDISKKLHDAGMLKATTIALQSMKDDTLVSIQRKNIKYDKLAELSRQYEDAGIATYAELIVGLPGETFDSFVTGIDHLIDAGQHDGISIYLCMLLPNTEMATPAYRQMHGIESVRMKALLYHGLPEPGVVEEIQDTVIATATMPQEDLKRAVFYGWVVQALHSFGLTQHLARKLRAHGFIKRYSEFYLALIDWWQEQRLEVGGIALWAASETWAQAVDGRSWPTIDNRFGDVMWPPEELLFLEIACASEQFYDEMLGFLDVTFDFAPIPAQLLREQRELFIPPERGKEAEYARDAVWYGRKGPGRKLRLRS